MSNLNCTQRLLAAAAAGLALCAFTLPAAAQDAQTISRDPGTGELRPATPAEHAQLQSIRRAQQARVAPKPTQQKFHASGARGVRLNDEFLTSATAVRDADGNVKMICNDAHGGAAAAPHVHAAPTSPVTE